MIKTRHSFYEARSSGSPNESASKTGTFSRSDINIIRSKDFPSFLDSGCVNRHDIPLEGGSSEQYSKNDDIEVPVQDSSKNLTSEDTATYDKELTNSDLDKMEIRVFKNMSKELQTDESSTKTEECNIKIFKTTVQEILDKFYSHMKDFEFYKKRFHDILSTNNENIVNEMECLIKEMIQEIFSSSCISSGANTLAEFCEIRTEVANKIDSSTFSRGTGDHNIEATVEAYKNDNYLTDSTFDRESSRMNHSTGKIYIYQTIYKLSPCIEIKLDDRNVLSEIHIRNRLADESHQVASAENIKKVAAKKNQVKKYMKQVAECESNDNIIPVKISYAMKDIHTEQCPQDVDKNKSFMYKICTYLCRKFRRTTFS